jgi:hypothetical protein
LGEATAATGATRGLIGRAASTTGIGVWGYAFATSGATTGVRGDVWSPNGIAGIFNTVNPTGKILVGRVNNSDKFSVDGSGNVAGSGTLTGTRLISNVATGTAPLTINSTTLVPNLNADLLDGFHAGTFATLGSNIFVGNQSIAGLVAASGTTTALGSVVLYATQGGSTTTEPVDVSTLSPSAIIGSATATTGYANGVVGTTATSADSAGVLGAALNSGGKGVGVLGLTTSTDGESAGVIAVSLATTGNAIALGGTVSSATGVAGQFDSSIAGAKLIKGTVTTDTQTEVFNVNTNGDVTTIPGDFRALGAGKGLILKSPNGATCARISIDNAGAVVSSVVTCP